jgi:hypothetical protein
MEQGTVNMPLRKKPRKGLQNIRKKRSLSRLFGVEPRAQMVKALIPYTKVLLSGRHLAILEKSIEIIEERALPKGGSLGKIERIALAHDYQQIARHLRISSVLLRSANQNLEGRPGPKTRADRKRIHSWGRTERQNRRVAQCFLDAAGQLTEGKPFRTIKKELVRKIKLAVRPDKL